MITQLEPLETAPPPLSGETFRRRQRGRNLALFAVLLGLALLFYAITIAKLTTP